MSQQEFTVWMVGIAAGAVVLLWLIYWMYRIRLLDREERRLMIERGMVPPPPQPTGWPAVKAREQELQFEERRLLIEKGLQPGAHDAASFLADLLAKRDARPPEYYLRRGLVALASGLGLGAAYIVFNRSGVAASEETRNWFLFFAVISPFVTLYGVGTLVHYALTRNKPREESATAPDPAR